MIQATDGKKKERPKPVLTPELCKGCGRCIEACPRDCISLGHAIDQHSGLIPVTIDYEACNGCELCLTACPEPYGLLSGAEVDGAAYDREQAAAAAVVDRTQAPAPATIPASEILLSVNHSMVLKGTHAMALGAILAGCRHVFGYPITPSTEGAELMARLMPDLGGVFLQAASEVATVNHMYGCGGAGIPCMTFTSSPGFSLMLEGISYMIGAEVPAVFVNVMRGGPGLGNIGPEQADIKLMCRGLGHGNTRAIVFAPTTPQEALDLTMDAFELTFRYRSPVMIAGDGYLGQMSGRVVAPSKAVRPGLPSWAVYGDLAHKKNLVCSIYISEQDLERHNEMLEEKYARMQAHEQRSTTYRTDDAKVLLIACNTPARMAKGAAQRLREEGIAAGLFCPITLWPFPIDALLPLAERMDEIVVVEASSGQLEDEVRLALSRAGARPVPIRGVRRMGGVLPQVEEIVEKVRLGMTNGHPARMRKAADASVSEAQEGARK